MWRREKGWRQRVMGECKSTGEKLQGEREGGDTGTRSTHAHCPAGRCSGEDTEMPTSLLLILGFLIYKWDSNTALKEARMTE